MRPLSALLRRHLTHSSIKTSTTTTTTTFLHRYLPRTLATLSADQKPLPSATLHPTPPPPRYSKANTPPSPLVDTFNRPHTYLRLSLTERCNLRCIYCMPDTTPPAPPPPTHLTNAELHRLATLFVSHGVTKIRLTGGEPLLRTDLVPLMQSFSSLKSLSSLAITTNAITLSRNLTPLLEAGLTAVNISLDTLDPHRFPLLTRRNGHDRVLRAIHDCLDVPHLSTKVNAVIMRGVNDDELADFVRLTEDKKLDVRFIEYMPFDGNRWADSKFLSYANMLQIIARTFGRIEAIPVAHGDTSKYYRVPGFAGRIGFISSMTDNFCSGCNRLRITADGNLKVCLFGKEEFSLRDLIRAGASNDELVREIRRALLGKHFSLGGNKDMYDISRSENRSMVRIGG